MTARLSFDVIGLPVPQGSMQAFVRGGRAIISHQHGADLAAWRTAIAQEARAAIATADLFAGPLTVRMIFRLPRPASHTGKRGLLPSAPDYPAKRPDLSKLIRAAEDALTGVVWTDDCQVSELRVVKDFAMPGSLPGVSIDVSERLA